MKPKFKCCEVETACGHNLWEGVVFVGIATLAISTTVLLSSVGLVVSMAVNPAPYNNQPVRATNLLCCLVSTSLSCFQIVISLLLFWQAYRKKNEVFLCALWYVSHISILTLYCLLLLSKVVVSLMVQNYLTAFMTFLIGIIYQALFIYFAIVVNSYLHSVDGDRYF